MPFRFPPGWTRHNDAALAAFVVGVATLAASLGGAAHVAPADSVAAPVERLHVPELPQAAAPITDEVLFGAAERDPFVASLAGYDAAESWTESEAAGDAEIVAAPPAVRLSGVVLLPGGGAAVLAVDGRPAQLVRVGATLDGWRLVRVASGAATVAGPDGTLQLRLPAPVALAQGVQAGMR